MKTEQEAQQKIEELMKEYCSYERTHHHDLSKQITMQIVGICWAFDLRIPEFKHE